MYTQTKPFNEDKLFQQALMLTLLTIVYNIAEGLISIYFGMKDETLALFGFGADSFIETISALGIMQMIYRIKKQPRSHKGRFEVNALRITGWCFYALALMLTISAIHNIIEKHVPASTLAGLIIAAVSILTMWLLVYFKMKTGNKLNSEPVMADARCNMVCLYMSLVLLLTSGLNTFFTMPYIDAAGALGLVFFSIKEGREAFKKAKGIACC